MHAQLPAHSAANMQFHVKICFACICFFSLVAAADEFRECRARSNRRYWLASSESGHLTHVKDAFARLGWEPALSADEDWTVMWAFHNPFFEREGEVNTPDILQRLQAHQMVNQLPGSAWFASKIELVQTSKRLPFLPASFRMPVEHGDFEAFAQARPELEWIRKNSLHRGVRAVDPRDPSLTAQVGDAKQETFVQQLIRPMLIDSKLWDVGLYVAVTSVEPLRVYVFDNILMRHCSANYSWDLLDAPAESYVVAENYDPPWALASLRPYYTRGFSTLNVIRAYMHDHGMDFDVILDEMKADVVRLLHHHASALVAAASRYPHGSRSFFAMYRMDFMVDLPHHKPWLIEVNQSPNLSSYATPDLKRMFQRISLGLLSLLGFGPGQLRDPDRAEDQDEILLHHSEIDVGWRLCSGDCAEDSCDGECVVCRRCRTADDNRILMETVSEHRNRQAFVRIYPLDDRLANRSDLQDVGPQTPADRMLQIWLRERCLQEYSWC